MSGTKRQAGMTLIEIVIVVVVIGLLIGISFTGMESWQRNERATSAARSVGDALRMASADAIRTGSVHLVFLSIGGGGDTAGNPLMDASGNPAVIVVLNDGAPGTAGQNCVINAGEDITAIQPINGIGWGSSQAAGVKAPGDGTAIASTTGSSFVNPAGVGTTWVAFMPDGRPLGFDNTCSFGQLGSGNGAIYVTNGLRDYAVVLNALGGVRIHAWDANAGGWQG